jgi:hypothetical protein
MLAQRLHQLKGAIAQARTLPDIKAAIEALAPMLGVAYSEHAVFGRDPYRYATISLAQPIPARACCEALGWERPYALSTDVHQTRWQIQLWVEDLEDPYGPRIHTRLPTLGAWAVLAQLNDRPAGALPPVQAGASPAYDLALYDAAISAIEVSPVDH